MIDAGLGEKHGRPGGMDASDLETTQTGGALYTSKVDIETTQKSSDELFTLTVDLKASRTDGKVITSTSKDNGEEGRQGGGKVITSTSKDSGEEGRQGGGRVITSTSKGSGEEERQGGGTVITSTSRGSDEEGRQVGGKLVTSTSKGSGEGERQGGGKLVTSTSTGSGEEGRQGRGRVITSGVITETNDRGESAEEIGQTTAMTAAGQRVEGRHFGVASQLQTAETEQLMAAEGEVKKTFAIKSVVNPADGTDISLQQAIVLGVILPDEGIYVNSVTGEKKPIPSAMSEGLIKVCIFKTSSSIEACVRLV